MCYRQNKLINILTNLKDKFSAIAVKADFEAEGTDLEDLIFLSHVVHRVGLNLFIKIGGCEAIFDLSQARLFGADAVIVPVVETPFAMSKFTAAVTRVYGANMEDVDFVLNTETKTCVENIDQILKSGENILKSVTIGRVDLTNSFGLSRNEIDSDLILNVCSKIFEKAKNFGLKVGLGGGLTSTSYRFLELNDFDRFETRKIVFKNNHNKDIYKEAILEATRFEIECLKCNNELFSGKLKFNRDRIEMMERRMKDLEF